MSGMEILRPVVALAAWTMVMAAWLYAVRIPRLRAANLSREQLAQLNAARLDALLPPRVQWVGHNYNHLHEAPTVFYAVAVVLAVAGQGDGVAALLGWIYVALRVLHSLVQATVNRVVVRLVLFMASTAALIALIAMAALAVF